MIDKSQIEVFAKAWLEEEGGFLVEVKVSADNRISIAADKPGGIRLEDLSRLHRHIEGQFDRETVDFELEVSSPGMDRPFVVFEQYLKNLGRTVKVKKKDGVVLNGVLHRAEPTGIVLLSKNRVPKETGKGKVTVEAETSLPFEDIVETKLDFRF